jgi:hypothetical protein
MTTDGLSVMEWRAASAASAGDRDAYSIPEWCRRNGFSPSFFFKLQKKGLGPRVMRVGRRTLVSREANDEWRREREAASAP